MVQVLFAKPVIDEAGNIQLHGRGGLSLTYQRLDATGAAQDISTNNLFFEIDGIKRVALGAGADAQHRTIVVEPADIAKIPLREPVAFALRDETGDPAVVRWDGWITVRGFEVQPSA